jgi:hypothetical protein
LSKVISPDTFDFGLAFLAADEATQSQTEVLPQKVDFTRNEFHV